MYPLRNYFSEWLRPVHERTAILGGRKPLKIELIENDVLQQATNCPDIFGGAAPPVNHDFFGSQY